MKAVTRAEQLHQASLRKNTETYRRANDAVIAFTVACYRSEIKELGLVEACRRFLTRDLGGPGAEITEETLSWIRRWEEIADATVTLQEGWRFTVEPRS